MVKYQPIPKFKKYCDFCSWKTLYIFEALVTVVVSQNSINDNSGWWVLFSNCLGYTAAVSHYYKLFEIIRMFLQPYFLIIHIRVMNTINMNKWLNMCLTTSQATRLTRSLSLSNQSFLHGFRLLCRHFLIDHGVACKC